jgi:hypothetical protein
MEYIASVQIQMPTILSCSNCDLWFSIEYAHCCSIDANKYRDIKWNLI